MNDELTDVLNQSAPAVARNGAIDAEVAGVTRAVIEAGRASRRRARIILSGAALTLVAGTGAAAAGTLGSGFWGEAADVKVVTDPEGVTCELVFTVSDGASAGRPAEDRREARRVASTVLAEFAYSPGAVAEELSRNPKAYARVEPRRTSADDELQAHLGLANRAVQRELASRGLPEVNVAAESACGQDRHQ